MYREFEDSHEGFDTAEYEYYMNDRYEDTEVDEDEDERDDYDESMDGDFDSGMASAGFGTDEDYGYYGEDCE